MQHLYLDEEIKQEVLIKFDWHQAQRKHLRNAI